LGKEKATPNKNFQPTRKLRARLKLSVLGGCAAENRGADRTPHTNQPDCVCLIGARRRSAPRLVSKSRIVKCSEYSRLKKVSGHSISQKIAPFLRLEEITKIDPTVFEVAKIEPGFHAWRNKIGDAWIIAKTPKQADE